MVYQCRMKMELEGHASMCGQRSRFMDQLDLDSISIKRAITLSGQSFSLKWLLLAPLSFFTLEVRVTASLSK